MPCTLCQSPCGSPNSLSKGCAGCGRLRSKQSGECQDGWSPASGRGVSGALRSVLRRVVGELQSRRRKVNAWLQQRIRQMTVARPGRPAGIAELRTCAGQLVLPAQTPRITARNSTAAAIRHRCVHGLKPGVAGRRRSTRVETVWGCHADALRVGPSHSRRRWWQQLHGAESALPIGPEGRVRLGASANAPQPRQPGEPSCLGVGRK